MFGPLPTLHRLLLVVGAVVVCVGIGLWFGAMPEVPFTPRVGLLVGATAGGTAAFALVHDFHHREARSARARRHRL